MSRAEDGHERVRPDTRQGVTSVGRSLALAKELDMRPLAAHCHLALGDLHHRIGRREQARAELDAAIALYDDMGMSHYPDQARVARSRIS